MPIALVSQNFVLSGGTATSNMSIPAPAGLNASMLDLLIAFIRDSNANSAMTIGTDGGAYTAVEGANLNNTGGIMGDFAIQRKTGAASPGAVNVTWTSYTRRHLGRRIAWSGVDLASPIDAQSSSLTTGFVGTEVDPVLSVPGITTVTNGALAIAYLMTAGRADGFSTPAGWTQLAWDLAFYGATTVSAAFYSKPMPAAGATGNADITMTQAGGDPYYNWAGGMLALKPDLTIIASVMRARQVNLGL